MVITRGYDRLVNLSDAVIAIAVTLLILPLVDAAGAIGTTPPGDFLYEQGEQLFLFALSFVVIADFWLIHHRLYRQIDGYTIPLVWWNFLWLLTIVFLPFPTVLLGESSAASPVTSGLYIGTMVVTTYAGVAQQLIIVRRPELQLESARGTVRLSSSVVPAAAMTAAFLVSVFVPGTGVWPLLILIPTGFIERQWAKSRRTRQSVATPTPKQAPTSTDTPGA
ncbi:TMEM175 family protein [soil metagenome]